MIANELGDREENNGMYHSLGSLASFILAVKPGKDVLEDYLYREDLLCETFLGFRTLTKLDDEIAVAVLSKYPVVLLKPHINRQHAEIVSDQEATWTLLHLAAANRLEKTIVKLHQLGVLYQDTRNFLPMLNNRLTQPLMDYSRMLHCPLFGHLGSLRWKPGFVPCIMDDERTYTLLARLWDAYSVATWHFRYAVIINKPADYPMTLHHLVILGPDRMSLRWTKYAARNFPGWVEAPCGETRSSLLHVALKTDNKQVLKFLLERGIGFGPHFVDTDGNNPFHILINEGLQATNAKKRAEWRKLKDVLFNTVPQLEWNTMMVQTRHPRGSPLHLAIEYARHHWGPSRVAIKEIIDFVLEQEMILLKKWNFPPKSLLINLPNADGDTPLSLLANIIDNREQAYSRTHWDLFDCLIEDHGADINLDVNAIFTPKSYKHSIANQVHRKRRFVDHVYDSLGEEHRAEIESSYPISNPTPTSMKTYKFHAHQLPPGNPLNLPVPFGWPLLPLPPMTQGLAVAVVYRERRANYAITGRPDLSPYFAHIPYAQPTIAAAANPGPAATSAAEAAQADQDKTRV
jgi:hypothetical protein